MSLFRDCCHLHLLAFACLRPCSNDPLLIQADHERTRVVHRVWSFHQWLSGFERHSY
jgi:hypothetical protein